VLGFSQGGGEEGHIRTPSRYTMERTVVARRKRGPAVLDGTVRAADSVLKCERPAEVVFGRPV